MKYNAKEFKKYPEIMNKEQIKNTSPHQQADGALSSPIQPDSAHLHRQENPLLRHQKERCDRFYERP